MRLIAVTIASVLLASAASADDKCVKGPIVWERTESGMLEAQPLAGLNIVASKTSDPRAVMFVIVYLEADVSCGSTMVPGIGGFMSCGVPLLDDGTMTTYLGVSPNGEASGEICVRRPQSPAKMVTPTGRPKVRS